MFGRKINLIFLLLIFGLAANAEVNFTDGEINLTGKLLFDKNQKNPRLVVNPKSRSMRAIKLQDAEGKSILEDFKSGTEVEMCIDIKKGNDPKSQYSARIIKLRPLNPDETIGVLEGELVGCASNKGCRNYGTTIEKMYGNLKLGALSQSEHYYSCLP